jgi:F-type H+-transporting ATPase subunit c
MNYMLLTDVLLDLKAVYALAAALAIGLAAMGGAIAMGIATAKAVEAIARQPEAENKIKSSLILGVVFIETAIIYALIISILIVINIL